MAKTKKAKTYFIASIILIILVTIFYLILNKNIYSYPTEYKLNVVHVSDQEETEKIGKKIGGNCYFATVTMLLKNYDPSIEFWRVVLYSGTSVSFSYYWPNGVDDGTMASLADDSTDTLLTAASNLGYTPHVRMNRFIDGNMKSSWSDKTKKLGGDFRYYYFNQPMDEYKNVIASGIPLGTSGSPCHNDYNVIEGYDEDELFAVIPDPSDVNRTNPEISCPTGSGLTNIVFWFTPDGKKISDRDLMLKMKGTVNESLDVMEKYVRNLKEDVDIIEFQQKIYLGRKIASMYFNEQGYSELATGYEKSAELLLPLTSIYPPDINKRENKDLIVAQIEKVLENERSLVKYWEAIN
jgi:hypothetical protein